jgi:hypothetical protein
MHAPSGWARSGWSIPVLLLLGCGEEVTPVPCSGSRCSSQEIRILSEVQTAPPIDLVVVLDDSPSLAPRQARVAEKLARTFEQAFGSLRPSEGPPRGEFDLEIRVISSTARVGDGTLPGCAGPPVADCPQPAGGVRRWNRRCDGTGPNFEGMLEGALACATRFPSTGCAIEQPFAAVAANLEKGPPLRPDAELVLFFVTEEDDCSFDGAPPFAVDPAAATADGPELSQLCRDAHQAGNLTPVSRYVEWLRSLKRPGTGVHVSVIAGPMDEISAAPLDPRGLCATRAEAAQPAPRLWQLARALEGGGYVFPFCAGDWTQALDPFARFPMLLGDRCIPTPLLDLDPDEPGLQPDCYIQERAGAGAPGRLLPACRSAGPPCWTLIPNPACGSGYYFEVDRDGCVPPRGTVLDVRCAAAGSVEPTSR